MKHMQATIDYREHILRVPQDAIHAFYDLIRRHELIRAESQEQIDCERSLDYARDAVAESAPGGYVLQRAKYFKTTMIECCLTVPYSH